MMPDRTSRMPSLGCFKTQQGLVAGGRIPQENQSAAPPMVDGCTPGGHALVFLPLVCKSGKVSLHVVLAIGDYLAM